MYKKHKQQTQTRFADVDLLEARILQQSPKQGEYLYDYKLEQALTEAKSLQQPQFHRKYKINFADLPISRTTLKGLNSRDFTKMTEIQRCVIPHALVGRDVLAASKTGSGKTLAYLIPLVEKLYRQKFIPIDGLGAIVLVPVREIAMQVFEVLNSFTKQMELSVGLIIGGKDIQYEKGKICNMNILICTPGRLLQHIQSTFGFQTGMLQMLVIDEADQMLEMEFQETLNSILKSLPPRQTMLFSATLNKNIHNLARLSLNQPQRIFLHSVNKQAGDTNTATINNIYETPLKLMQYYMEVPHQNKINTLYSFIKQHPKKKILVFLSTCKQVRFIYEAFKTFKFGCPIYELQGRQKQTKRMAIFYTFCQKQYGILFCTNIAARGLDFPHIDWVIQCDIPQDVETYVHRVGRTARFRSEGRSLMFVDPSEIKFSQLLKSKKIVIHKISQNPQKYYKINQSLQARCSQNIDLKYLAQRAIVSYLKFVHKAPNKEFFNIKNINTQLFSDSFGLINAPVINVKKREQKNQSDQQQNQPSDQKPKLSKIQKLRQKAKEKKLQKKMLLQPKQKLQKEQDEEFLVKKKINPELVLQSKILPTLSKRQLNKVKMDGHYGGKNKIIFDAQGNATTETQITKKNLERNRQVELNILQRLHQRVQQNKELDIATEKQRVKEKRIKRKQRQRKQRIGEQQQNYQAVLDSQEQD